MDQNWSKPRKIFHLDRLQIKTGQSEQQFFTNKWAVIQKTVVAYLLQDSKPPSIVHMNRALHSLLIRNHYDQLHANLIKIFYRIYKQILGGAFLQSNCLISLLAYYIHKKHHYRILFDVLNNFLKGHSQQRGQQFSIEEQAYRILSKEIINSQFADKFSQEFHNIVHQFRATTDENELLSIQYQLKIISFLGIYQYFDQEFIQKSKQYFVNFSEAMVKNQDIFYIIDAALKKQTALNKLLTTSQNTVAFLQKELIQQYYPFMIEYMDYLIQESKLDKLRLLWNYSLRLSEQERYSLYARLKEIVKDISIYLKQGQNISHILQFIDKINNIISACFDSNKVMINSLYNTIEQTLMDNQKDYNEALGLKIFKQSHQNYDVMQHLFKLIPNKEKFVRQLEVMFFKWIVNSNVTNAKYQEGIVQMIKKQCGNNLCKKIERMINDVWRDGHMIYYGQEPSNFKCRLLSFNDWPKFKYANFLLPDAMTNIIALFESDFKKSPEHACKQLKWVNELGSIRLTINQVQSLFSQFQAAVIFVLDKSFRPMKAEQLSEVLQGDMEQIETILEELVAKGILQCNYMNQTYDINDSNSVGYFWSRMQKDNMEQVSIAEKRDNTIIIQAAIVRIMKKKKILLKTELTNFVFQQINNAKPSLEEINHAIQRLANRDFIEIDKVKGILRYRQ